MPDVIRTRPASIALAALFISSTPFTHWYASFAGVASATLGLYRRTMRILRTALFLGTAAIVAAQPPATPKRPVTDTYHGVSVRDDYRWLEDFSNPEVKAWSDAQNAYARKYLDGLSQRAVCYEEIRKLVTRTSAGYY